ncbi:MAG TPA: flavodoxin domain-containing protein [Nocardioides sp.]|nr:flavodoxin domain-containing protein [Nocardioides sp.]
MTPREPSALVVYESMFGNTAETAEAVARGLRRAGLATHIVPVGSLAATGPVDVDLLAVGAPTHGFTLSRRESRAEAVRKGAAPERATIGLREWIAQAAPQRFGTVRVVVFDTRIGKVRHLPLTAATTAARLLRRRGFQVMRKPTGFVVERVRGPLHAGELARAENWGRRMGAACLEQLSDAA